MNFISQLQNIQRYRWKISMRNITHPSGSTRSPGAAPGPAPGWGAPPSWGWGASWGCGGSWAGMGEAAFLGDTAPPVCWILRIAFVYRTCNDNNMTFSDKNRLFIPISHPICITVLSVYVSDKFTTTFIQGECFYLRTCERANENV